MTEVSRKETPSPPASDEILKLDNQLCFPLYAVSRMITRCYQPLLKKLGLTYPQYLVLLVLWEKSPMTVQEISSRLLLNTNTLTPLMKRLQYQEIIVRKRSRTDERRVIIELTEKGRRLKTEALSIPDSLLKAIDYPVEDLLSLREGAKDLLHSLRPHHHPVTMKTADPSKKSEES
ncbi:MAG: MarR family transcriptional regulator [Spirochaetales bacterium]|nr:MarR family transcriptional regulator [Spirochaetales bacterium]